jgi:hypothetical protein
MFYDYVRIFGMVKDYAFHGFPSVPRDTTKNKILEFFSCLRDPHKSVTDKQLERNYIE